MNIAKNMEVIFFAAIALASVTGFATASADAPVSRAPAYSSAVAPQGAMQVVTVKAKRMTAAEKAAAAE